MNNLRLFIWIIYKMFLWQRQPLLQTFQNIWCLHCGVFTERFDWRFHLRVYLEGCWLESVFTWVFFTFGRHVFIVEEFFTWECFDFERLPSSWMLLSSSVWFDNFGLWEFTWVHFEGFHFESFHFDWDCGGSSVDKCIGSCAQKKKVELWALLRLRLLRDCCLESVFTWGFFTWEKCLFTLEGVFTFSVLGCSFHFRCVSLQHL